MLPSSRVPSLSEAYFWLWQNTKEDARVMSWWDYGYQIAGMANRTTLVDNNTWNNSHIALVGKAMASNESEAYKVSDGSCAVRRGTSPLHLHRALSCSIYASPIAYVFYVFKVILPLCARFIFFSTPSLM